MPEFKVARLGVIFPDHPSLSRLNKSESTPFRAEIWVVDEVLIRDEGISLDFYAGHPLVYDFIPNGEIWLPQSLPVIDIVPFTVHEYKEAVFMLKHNFAYERAHEEANTLELILRKTRSEWENADILSLLEAVLETVS